MFLFRFPIIINNIKNNNILKKNFSNKIKTITNEWYIKENNYYKIGLTNNITDITNQEKGKLIKIVDIIGREVINTKNSPLFYIYENGSVKKEFIIK